MARWVDCGEAMMTASTSGSSTSSCQSRRRGESQRHRGSGPPIRASGGDHLQPWPQSGVKHRANGSHGHRMGLAHVAAADDADANLPHVSSSQPKFSLQPVAKSVSSESEFRKRHFANRKKSGLRAAAIGRYQRS
jgi:hypothetical protein